jgi:glycosyltransferase involved in cell wall biosynthesis
MMKKETISVAMCTYNGGRFVGAQLESIAAQTRAPDELVVCDDRSSDETTRVVEAFAAAAPFPVRLFVNERNLGSTRNFERAIGLCEGELIALSDQDDVWLPEKLERMEAEFVREPRVGLVFTDAEVVDENLQPLGYTIWQSLDFDAQRQKTFCEGGAFEMLLMQNVVTGAAMTFRARFRDLALPVFETVVSRYGMEDWSLIHDGWIALMISAVADVVPAPEPLIKYRQHSSQQVGINAPVVQEPMAPAGLRARAAEQYKEFFERELELLGVVRARLAAAHGAFDCEATLAELDARMEHLRARTSLPDSRLARAPLVMKELLARRYFRYSNGITSAVRDLLL